MVKQYIFTLNNINFQEIDSRYNIDTQTITTIPENTTKIEDVMCNSDRNTISFVDEAKRHVKGLLSTVERMVDDMYQTSPCNLGSDCFWCDIPFKTGTVPIGCPIRYVPHQAVQTYYSDISKATYTIKQFISNKRKTELEMEMKMLEGENDTPPLTLPLPLFDGEDKKTTLEIVEGDRYISDGAFCSFNCVQAFIEENAHNPLYNNSSSLLLEIYHRMFPDHPVNHIVPASHWRTRQRKGGFLTDEEFRKSFNYVEYVYHGYHQPSCQPHHQPSQQPSCQQSAYRPKFTSIAHIYEEKMRF